MIKKGDNVILKFSTMWDGEICRDHGKAYIYPSMNRAIQFCHPDFEELVEYTPVKHGKWIYEPVEFTYEKDIKCSVCGSYVEHTTNYCPDCGACMTEEN